MKSSSNSMKYLAKQLADKIYSNDAKDILRLMQQVGLLVTPSSVTKVASENSQSGEPSVGIWSKKITENGNVHFTRNEKMSAEWSLWSQNPKISLKGDKKRVVYLGESAARGFLYDPSYTPAGVLESLLQSQLGEVDVVDLARTNADITLLTKTAEQALVLEPDALVIFAGNNWGPHAGYFSDTDLCRELASALREGGIPGFRRFIENTLVDEIKGLCDDIERMYQGIPVYWIIPEFCLGDWKDPDINAPWLGESNNIAWIEAHEKAKTALDSRDFELALHNANMMKSLDKGDCSTSHYILAKIYEYQGEIELQRQCLEQARDASLYDLTRHNSPRIMTLSQKVFREKGLEHGHQIIDLPAIFREHMNNSLPDRQLFLDYCHLSSEGIRVVMSATATNLLSALSDGKLEVKQKELFQGTTSPDNMIEAEAYLLAAIHNAHWGQSPDLVLYYCKQALAFSENIAHVMRDYIEIQNNMTPIWMQKITESLIENISPMLQRYFFQMEFKSLDETLFNAFSESLNSLAPGTSILVEQTRINYHSICKKETNLLAPFYHNTSLSNEQTLQNASLHFNDYHKAFDIISLFRFVGEEGKDAKAKVTLRLPHSEQLNKMPIDVYISVNNERLLTIKANQSWQSHEFDISGQLLRSGINNVEIQWPVDTLMRHCANEEIADMILLKRVPELFPVFGHIHTFSVASAKGYIDEDLTSLFTDSTGTEDSGYTEEFI
jgi:hypothetical protein